MQAAAPSGAAQSPWSRVVVLSDVQAGTLTRVVE